MKNKSMTLIVIISLISATLQAQDDLINTDYMTFGRKEPASFGSLFSALGNEPIFQNPANVALITDNRITVGGSISDLGDSYILSWTAPNLSLSSARHTVSLHDSSFNSYRKELLKASFAVSNNDLGFSFGEVVLSAGMAIKRLSDLLEAGDSSRFGGDALSIDFGFVVNWNNLTFDLSLLNLNEPRIGDTGLHYGRAVSLGLRYRASSGFLIAVQGINSSTYAGSDVGINLAAEQSFLDNRLTSRIQLTSFFSGTEAIMQNISGGISYRPLVPADLSFLQDIEFSYALSFLALPQNVGTHVLVLTKYF